MNSPVNKAICEDCTYKLYGRGPIATEAFGIKHASKNNHSILIQHGEKWTRHNFHAIMEQSDSPPF